MGGRSREEEEEERASGSAVGGGQEEEGRPRCSSAGREEGTGRRNWNGEGEAVEGIVSSRPRRGLEGVVDRTGLGSKNRCILALLLLLLLHWRWHILPLRSGERKRVDSKAGLLVVAGNNNLVRARVVPSKKISFFL